MKKLILGVFILSVVIAVSLFADRSSAKAASPVAGPIRVDDFTYATGQLTDAGGGANVSGGNWVTNTGTGNFLLVSAGSLSYSGYPSSGVGNKLDIISTTGSAEDTFRNFSTQTAGTTYAAFMVNVTNTTGLAANTSTTGDYFAGLISSTSTTNFSNRVTIRAGTVANTYQIGFRATGNANNTQIFSNTDLPVGATALIVISYQIIAGATNDVCNIWVNPVITSPQPVATLSQVSAADSTDVGRFFIRQGTAGTPNASIDGLRVATSWADLSLPFVASDAPYDFNGDGKTDYAVVRNATGGANGQLTWYTLFNGTGTGTQASWGIALDTIAPGDYDGDGKDDIAIWRSGAPLVAGFYILQSSNGVFRFVQFGQTADIPVVTDYTGDGLDDPAIYREGATANSQSTFWYQASSGPLMGQAVPTDWGIRGDDPVPGDYTGDGKADFCVQRGITLGQPSITYAFFYMHPGTGGGNAPGADTAVQLGFANDDIVAADYDGDGKTDVGVVRGQGGQYVWYYFPSSGGPLVATTWGLPSVDYITAGDYDGDGKTDQAVWRRSAEGGAYYFYVNGSTAGPSQTAWGLCTNVPLGNCDLPVAVDGVRSR